MLFRMASAAFHNSFSKTRLAPLLACRIGILVENIVNLALMKHNLFDKSIAVKLIHRMAKGNHHNLFFPHLTIYIKL